MARFFIDTDDGDLHVRDDEGYVLPDAEAARRLAVEALSDMARDKLPGGDRGILTVSVSDGSGRVLYRAELALRERWMTAA